MRYAILALVCLAVILVAGCGTTNTTNTGNGATMASPIRQGQPIEFEPLVKGGGQPLPQVAEIVGYRVGNSQLEGVTIGSDDVAMQMGLLAQGLPTENWFQEILPDLFGPNIEEVRSDVIMYGAQLQAWMKTVAEVGSFKIGKTTITHEFLNGDVTTIETPSLETPAIRIATRDVPTPPRSLSGLQRLGVDAGTLVSGLIAFFAFDFAKSNEPTVVEPTVVQPQVIQVP